MDSSYIATAVALRDLKCYCIDTIADRILLQKKIYLAQKIGLPLGYGYSWYIHGPYSTDLTTVVYQIVPEGTESIENRKFKERYIKIIDKINALEDEIHKRELQTDVISWYELIASIAYWITPDFSQKDEILKKMQSAKPQFSKGLVEAGYDVYNKLVSAD